MTGRTRRGCQIWDRTPTKGPPPSSRTTFLWSVTPGGTGTLVVGEDPGRRGPDSNPNLLAVLSLRYFRGRGGESWEREVQ